MADNFDTGTSTGAETQTVNADSQGTQTQTGAETQTANADSQGTQTQTGAETQTANADLQGQESNTAETSQTTGQESQDDTEGHKQAHQTTAEERFEQLRREREEDRRKLAELEAKVTNTPKQDYHGEEVENAVKMNIAKATGRIAEIQAQININPDSLTPEIADELLRLQDWTDEAKAALKDNQKKRTEAQKQQEDSQRQNESYQKAAEVHQERLESAIKLIGEQEKIPAELGEKIRDFVAQEFQADPIFCAEAMEVLERRGYVAHVKFCLDHARSKMGKDAVAAQQKKDEGKEKHPGGAGSESTSGGNDLADNLSMEEWVKRRNKQAHG